MKETHKGKSKFCLRVQCLCTTVQSGEKKEIGKGHKDVDSIVNFKCAAENCLAFKGDWGKLLNAFACLLPKESHVRRGRRRRNSDLFLMLTSCFKDAT